jgi:hypothetical protein
MENETLEISSQKNETYMAFVQKGRHEKKQKQEEKASRMK